MHKQFIKCDTHLPYFCSQIAACGQVFEPKQAVPVACTSPAWIMVNHLDKEKTKNLNNYDTAADSTARTWLETAMISNKSTGFENTIMLTSTSQSALLLVAEVAD